MWLLILGLNLLVLIRYLCLERLLVGPIDNMIRYHFCDLIVKLKFLLIVFNIFEFDYL